MAGTHKVDDKDEKAAAAREALEAWLKNFNLWCNDAKQTGWQNDKA